MRKILLFCLLGLLLVSILINKPAASRAEEGAFCFAHISDNHVDEKLYYQTRLREAVNYFNTVLRPPFIVDTGDTVTNAYQSSFQKYFNIIKNSQIKIYTVPGNHEHQGGIQYFNQIIGPSNVSFDYNSYRFIGFDSLYSFIDYSWLEARLKEGTPGKIILFGHYPIETPSWASASLMDPRARAPIKNLVSKYGVIAYLSSHAHESFSVYNSQLRFWDIGAPATTHKNAYHLICVSNGNVSYYYLAIGQIPPIIPSPISTPTPTPTLTPQPSPTIGPSPTPTSTPTPTPTILPPLQSCYGIDDGYISMAEANSNFGNADRIRLEKGNVTILKRGFLKFNLAGLAPGTIINSANLKLYVFGWGGKQATINTYKVKKHWAELETTWYKASAINAWQVVGGDGVDDREQTPVARFNISNLGNVNIDLTGLVRAWVNEPNTNEGIIIMPDTSNTSFYIYSSEVTDEKVRPCLSIVQ